MGMLFYKFRRAMSIRDDFLLIGFAIFALEITFCGGNGVLCPNVPVTPYPIVQVPTQPVAAYPVNNPCPNVPVTPCSTVQVPQPVPAYPINNSCPNVPVTPCSTVQVPQPVPAYPINNPCPVTQCQTSSCDTQQICSQQCQTFNNCAYSTNCLNQPNCCYGSTIPCSGTTPPCVIPNPPPCVVPTTPPPTCVTIPPPTTLPPPPPPETTRPYEPTTSTPPPGTIIMCPPGTILIGRECHLLYCPRGTHMQNGRCIVIECPDGTVWTGHRCDVLEPVVQNITFHHNYITQFNQTKPDIVLNYVNNMVVNAPMTIHDEINNNNECNHDDYGDCEDETSTEITTKTTPPPSSTNCCIVRTPRICEQRNNRWQCYSRRSRKCGEFCVAPTIYLKPPRIYHSPQYLVMPPMHNDCQIQGNCGAIRGGYDCSGCAINYMSRCSTYCYQYSCPSHRCDFYDQQMYCANGAGPYGCQKHDGCLGDWCL